MRMYSNSETYMESSIFALVQEDFPEITAAKLTFFNSDLYLQGQHYERPNPKGENNAGT